MFGFFSVARANKENILYTILTIFLLERVRRGWNRIETKQRASNLPAPEIEKKQQTFMFGAGLLYAVPFVLPIVKYVYRSIDELSRYVGDLNVLTNLWAFAGVLVVTELFLAVVIYNLLGIYVDRMNSALGFFSTIGRSVMDGSRVAVQAGGNVGGRAAMGVRAAAVQAVSAVRTVVALGGVSVRHTVTRAAGRVTQHITTH